METLLSANVTGPIKDIATTIFKNVLFFLIDFPFFLKFNYDTPFLPLSKFFKSKFTKKKKSTIKIFQIKVH